MFFSWMLAGYAYVLSVNAMSGVASVEYLVKAAQQGISPELWNVVGVFGLMLAGLLMIFPRWITLAQAARHVLMTNFGLGCLMIGLLLGQATTSMPNSSLESWRFWFFSVAVGVLFAAVIAINFSVWYVASLVSGVSQEQGFLARVTGMSLIVRIPAATLVVAIPLAFLLAER